MRRLCKRIYIALPFVLALSISGGLFAAEAKDLYLSLSGLLYQVNRDGSGASMNSGLEIQGQKITRVFDASKSGKLLVGLGERNVIPNTEHIGGSDLFVMDLDGSSAKRITKGLEIIQAKWSPVDDQFVYVTRKMKLYLATVDGKVNKLISEAASNPSWSYDGKNLVYSHFDSPFTGAMGYTVGIATYNLDAGKEIVHTSGFDDCRPTFSPDGARVLFYSSLRTQVASEYILNLKDKKLQQITNLGLKNADMDDGFIPVHLSEPLWSADGSTIVFHTRYAEKEIWMLKLKGNKLVTSKKIGLGESPRWVEEGKSITFLDTTKDVPQVKEVDLE